MEYFDRDTEHIKYMDTLSGKFSYRSKVMPAVIAAVTLVSLGFMIKNHYFITLLILMGVTVMLLMLAMHIPCSYRADEDGFSIMSGLISRYFSYSEVNSVAVENRACGHVNGGTIYENVLTVSTNRGIYRFREKSGFVKKRSLRYLPNCDLIIGGHAELVRLKEFIVNRI